MPTKTTFLPLLHKAVIRSRVKSTLIIRTPADGLHVWASIRLLFVSFPCRQSHQPAGHPPSLFVLFVLVFWQLMHEPYVSVLPGVLHLIPSNQAFCQVSMCLKIQTSHSIRSTRFYLSNRNKIKQPKIILLVHMPRHSSKLMRLNRHKSSLARQKSSQNSCPNQSLHEQKKNKSQFYGTGHSRNKSKPLTPMVSSQKHDAENAIKTQPT